MAKYRKVDPRIWNDEKFRSLSKDGKLVFFFLLTHPYQTSLGAMRGTLRGLAAELGLSDKAFCKAFQESLSQGMVMFDSKALPAQPVDATHALNVSAGVANSSVLRGRSLSCRATASKCSCECTDRFVLLGK